MVEFKELVRFYEGKLWKLLKKILLLTIFSLKICVILLFKDTEFHLIFVNLMTFINLLF
jgi:hypothetical protein